MIEKLSEYKITSRDGPFINVECNTKIINTLVQKINELVDTVNSIQKHLWIHYELKTPDKSSLVNTQVELELTKKKT